MKFSAPTNPIFKKELKNLESSRVNPANL